VTNAGNGPGGGGMRQEKEPDVSVVVPVYRSAECLADLVGQVSAALNAAGRSYEIILVNDGSPDDSWARIVDLAGRYPALTGVNLRRNFGQDNALMAGLARARGRVAVIMDDDLQHDPRDIPRLVAKVEEGCDVCYACFARKNQAWWKNAGSRLADLMANVVLGKPKAVYMSPFKAIRREVVDEIAKYEGPFPYVDGLIFRVTNSIAQVDAEHHRRLAGRSNYDLARSVAVWLKLATGFSPAPLRLAAYLGFFFAVIGLILAVYFLIQTLVGVGSPAGWASTTVAVLVLGGVQLACLGMVGEYLGRVFLHLNRRPQYVVKGEVRGIGSRPAEAAAAEARPR
jgi:polyisoprenyl-phosphate glycosyltransferase